MRLPPGYRAVAAPGAWGFAAPGAEAWLEALLGRGETLHAWASGHPARVALRGRGTVWVVPPPPEAGGGRWAVRHYLRGGLLARRLGDRYLALGEPRPLREVRASVEAEARGVPTPRIAAGAVHRAGWAYRADLASEHVDGAWDLAETLFPERGAEPRGPRPDACAALLAAGRLVRTMEGVAMTHLDLHAKNVVLAPRGGGLGAWVVDLDRCAFDARFGVEARMRRRLEGSLRKLERRSGERLPDEAWSALAEGYAS